MNGLKKSLSSVIAKIPPSYRLPVIMGTVTVFFLLFFIVDFLGINVLPSGTVGEPEISITPTPEETQEEEHRGEDEDDIVIPTQQTRVVTKAPIQSTATPTKVAATATPTSAPTATPTNTPGPTSTPTTAPVTATPTVSEAPSPTIDPSISPASN